MGIVLQGCRLLKQCWNLSASTVLQGCRVFKQCWNLSVGTVLQGRSCICSVAGGVGCLSGFATYLPGLCCRGAAVKAVLEPTCRHCDAEVQAV